MKKASKVLSAAMALTLGVSLVSYGAAAEQAVAEPTAQNYAAQSYAARSADDELGGYLFVTFVGNDSAKNKDEEQIYFGISRDAKNWMKVNGGSPVLKSNVGEQGVRDPSIVRKPDGSGFYIVATDLSIARRMLNEIGSGNAWGDCQREGSHQLVVWESEDLVNWSDPWLTPEVAVKEAGCAWAPEAFWDASRNKYMVFWASMVDGRHRIYRTFTSDFREFTETEIYMDEGGRPWIDATIIEDNGTFYRFTKHEGAWKIYMEKSKSLDGPFEMVDTYTLDGQACYDYEKGFEGPTCVKVNNENQWCLLNDAPSAGGYHPFFTDNLDEGKFTLATDVSFDGTFRHGSVLPITNKEYNAICEKWMPGEGTESGKLIYSLDFTEDSYTESTIKATVRGTVGREQRKEGTYAAVISGDDNYIKIDGTGLISGLDSMTVSFMANLTAGAKSWLFFAAPNENAFGWGDTKSYLGTGYLLSGYQGIRAERLCNTTGGGPTPATKDWTVTGEWFHVSLVYRKQSTEVYLNGELVAKVSSADALTDILGDTPIIHLGRASWDGGEYSNYKISDFKIYNYARSASEVLAEYNSVK